MNYDEFEIIITKNGEIRVKLNGLEEKKIRYYREILEEAIGPVRKVIEISGEETPPGTVRFTETERKKTQAKPQEKSRH